MSQQPPLQRISFPSVSLIVQRKIRSIDGKILESYGKFGYLVLDFGPGGPEACGQPHFILASCFELRPGILRSVLFCSKVKNKKPVKELV